MQQTSEILSGFEGLNGEPDCIQLILSRVVSTSSLNMTRLSREIASPPQIQCMLGEEVFYEDHPYGRSRTSATADGNLP